MASRAVVHGKRYSCVASLAEFAAISALDGKLHLSSPVDQITRVTIQAIQPETMPGMWEDHWRHILISARHLYFFLRTHVEYVASLFVKAKYGFDIFIFQSGAPIDLVAVRVFRQPGQTVDLLSIIEILITTMTFLTVLICGAKNFFSVMAESTELPATIQVHSNVNFVDSHGEAEFKMTNSARK
jgi:hypothetical protein